MSKPVTPKSCGFSCSECGLRNCFHKDTKYPAFCLTERFADAAAKTKRLYGSDGVDAKLARAAAEIEGEYYGRLTRLEETIRFAQKLGVKKLGIASCVGLLDEATKYAKIVRSAGIKTRTVICKVGGIDKLEIGLADNLKICPGCKESCCNPVLQAEVLNEWGADLNIVFGLCVGHDAIFSRHSSAPAVVFMVKDRVLAHNPIAAIYTSHFYYKRVNDQATFPPPAREWDRALLERDTVITAADRERDEKLRYLELAEKYGDPKKLKAALKKSGDYPLPRAKRPDGTPAAQTAPEPKKNG